MKKILLLLSILFLVNGVGFSQSDSLRYWQDRKNDAGMKITIGVFANVIGFTGVMLNGWENDDAVSAFVMYNVPGLTFDIWGIIQLCKANKNIKKIKKKAELSGG